MPSKITGKGMGGCILALVDSSFSLMPTLKSDMQNEGFEVYDAPIDNEGIKCCVQEGIVDVTLQFSQKL